jgi:hypothetical protein
MARRSPRLLTLVALAAAAAAATACGGDSDGGGGAHPGDCSSAVDWRGQRYFGNGAPGYPPAGAAVTPKAALFTCDPKDAKPVTARRMAGVPPALGLRLAGDPTLVYLPVGTFSALPGHPLHEAVWHAADQPYRRGDGKRCAVRGRIGAVTQLNFTLRTAAIPALRVVVDVRTRIAGPTRGGQPFLRVGEAVAVTARRCALGDPGLARVTAVTVKPDAG